MNLRTRRRPVPQIPIVSLIDIMVVLLIFFMYNTTFRTQTTRMQIALPESKSMGSSTQAQDVRTALAISSMIRRGCRRLARRCTAESRTPITSCICPV